MYFYPDMPHHVIVYHLTVTLSSLNSCMDPVVYCFVTNNFQVIPESFFSPPPLFVVPSIPSSFLSAYASILPTSHNLFIHHPHLFDDLFINSLHNLFLPQATMRNIFRRAEPEQTSGDIISMQHSSKASGGQATAVTNVIMMTKIPTSPQRDNLKNHTL